MKERKERKGRKEGKRREGKGKEGGGGEWKEGGLGGGGSGGDGWLPFPRYIGLYMCTSVYLDIWIPSYLHKSTFADLCMRTCLYISKSVCNV
jgi:hypothetical protein